MYPTARHSSLLALLTLASAIGFSGCGQESEVPSPPDAGPRRESVVAQGRAEPPGPQDLGAVTTQEQSVAASVLPANRLFSTRGTYRAPTGRLYVDIKRESDHATYTVWRWVKEVADSTRVGIGGHTAPLSEKDLVMCWDEQGRLWVYHPSALVWCYYEDGEKLMRAYEGCGARVRTEMPVAFRESLPENIEELARKAVVNGAQ